MVLILMEEGHVNKVNGSDFCCPWVCSVSIDELNFRPNGMISSCIYGVLKWDVCDMYNFNKLLFYLHYISFIQSQISTY